MAVVAVTTDLSSGLVDDASLATSFAEPVGTGSVSGDDYADMKSFQDEADVYIQGIASVSGAYTTNAAQRGCLVTDSGAGGVSIPTDGAIMVWQWWISPSALDVYANAGMFVAIGSAQSDLEIFPVSGNNLDPSPLGGWYCYPVDPRAATAYETVGTPDSVTFRWIGGGIDAPKQARGLTHYAIDAIRFGRCTSVITGGDGADPDATFLDISDELQNGAEAGGGLVSYGTFDNIFGAFYMQGLLQMGITGTNPCVFTDSNKVINIRNTPAVGANFNRWEIQHASSIITLTGCSFNNIGVGNSVAPTASKGDLSVVDATATVDFTNCSFSDWGTFSWGSNTTLDLVAFRRCDLVTQNGATITGCTFDLSTSSVSLAVDDLSLVTGNTFNSDGSNHAVDLGIINTNTGDLTWNNTLSGYSGTGANAAILVEYNDTNSNLIINVTGGTTPTVNNATGTGNVVVQSSVPLSVKVVDGENVAITTAEVRIEETDGTLVAQGSANTGASSNEFTGSFGGTTPLIVRIKVRSSSSGETRYFPVRTGGVIEASTGLSTTITMTPDTIASA